MVRTVNGDRGSSVIPIGGDNWLFLGRGRHVWLDNNNVHMNGSSGVSLADGITASGTGKESTINSSITAFLTTIKNTVNSSGLIVMDQMNGSDDYQFCCGGWTI